MCGLVGWFGGGGRDAESVALATRMTRAIAHRGPDESGVFVDAGVGLGHARLSIVGLGDGGQPMALPEAELMLVFNGEIFNHVELRRDLEARGRRFRTGSDTEVILHLYDELGEACLERMNGDFAFALWDGRRRRVMLARDRMGVRPLYYTTQGGRLWFASEVKALLEAPGVEAAVDPIALDQIFTLWAPIAPRTPFRDIFELAPGEAAIADETGMRRWTWWSLDFPDAGDVDRERSEATMAAELRALLTEATRIRMRADVPVGAYLSGGLDSSIVSALAVDMTPEKLNTFSVAFDSAEHDESPFQQAMAEAIGTRHETILCRSGDIARVFPDVIAATERPILRTAPAPLFLLSGLVRERGMKVVLTGEGADEVFAGYDLFREAKVRRFCARQPGSTARPLLFRRLYPWLPGVQQQSADYLAAFFGTAPESLADPLHSHRPRLKGTAATKMFFSADLKAEIGGYDAAGEMIGFLPERFGRWHPLHQAQYLETRFLLPGYILSSQGDRVAMAHAVEGRFPFLDHRVVEFAAKLPPGVKLKGLEEKHILRAATRDLLPDMIAKRPKQPYRAPDSASFFGAGETAAVAAALGESALATSGLFNAKAVGRLVEKCRATSDGGFRDNAAFVGILSTQLWADRFTARRAVADRAA